MTEYGSKARELALALCGECGFACTACFNHALSELTRAFNDGVNACKGIVGNAQIATRQARLNHLEALKLPTKEE